MIAPADGRAPRTRVLLASLGAVAAAGVLCTLVSLTASRPSGAGSQLLIEAVAAMAVSEVMGFAVSAAVAAAVNEAVVLDVFESRLKCYETYLALPSPFTQCRAGYSEVHRYGLHLQCCPADPSDCYRLSHWGYSRGTTGCRGSSTCAAGYDLVDSSGCADVCCPANRRRSPCFESQRCFAECPAEFIKVEAGGWMGMPLPESISCTDICCPALRCYASTLCSAHELGLLPHAVAEAAGLYLAPSFRSERDCPVGFAPIQLNRTALPLAQRAAFLAADPLGCIDICCDEALLARAPNAAAAHGRVEGFDLAASQVGAEAGSLVSDAVTHALDSTLNAGVVWI